MHTEIGSSTLGLTFAYVEIGSLTLGRSVAYVEIGSLTLGQSFAYVEIGFPTLWRTFAYVEIVSPTIGQSFAHVEKAYSRYASEKVMKLLKGDNKELLIIPGASHCDLYDSGRSATEGDACTEGLKKDKVIPFDKIEAFFKENLK